MYARLRACEPVADAELLALMDRGTKALLERHTRQHEAQWKRVRADIDYRWAGTRLPGLAGVEAELATLVARSLDYRIGAYKCLIHAEDLLSVPDLAGFRYGARPPRPGGDVRLCARVVLLLYFWAARAPPAPDVTGLFRVEDVDHGWALQWRESGLCGGESDTRYDIAACRPTLLRAGQVLTVNGTITYAGDINGDSFRDPRDPRGPINTSGVPWIWTWRGPREIFYTRWRVLPPRGEAYIVNATRMHFNTLRLQEVLARPPADRVRTYFGFGPGFDVRRYAGPSLDHNEITLRPGSRLLVETVESTPSAGGVLQTVTARQLRWSPAVSAPVSAPVTTAPVATASRAADGHDWCNTTQPNKGGGLLAVVLAGQMHAALDGLYCAHARGARALMARATGLRIKTVLVAWHGDLLGEGSLTRAAVDHVLEVRHNTNNTARAALVQTFQKKERVQEMLEAVSAGITFAMTAWRADWVMRLRIDISLSKFCLPAALDPHACYGHRNPGARKNADRTDKVCDIAMLGKAPTMRAVYAPHRWDRYVAGASPIEQLMEDRTRAHCAFRHAPVALYIVKPGDRDGARNRSAPPAQDVHLRHWDGDGRKDRLWHAGALPPDTRWCS